MIEMPSQTFDVQDFIDRQRLRPVHFGILALCFLVMFVDGFDIYMVGKIAPAIAGDFGAAPAAITPVIVMQQIGLATGAFLMSPLGDRLGRKRMLLIAFAAFGLLTIATAFSPSIMVLAALRGITGLFLAAVLPYAVALISEFTPLRQRAMFLSAGMAGFSLGNVAGSMTALLVPDYGWEAGFFVGGAMPLALLPVLALCLPESMKAHLKGYTVHIHAISDAAVDMALDAIEAARKADGVTTRPDTLAHIQCATAADLKRIGDARLNIAYTYSWMYAEPKGYDLSTIPFFDKVHGNSYEALHDPKGYFEQCTYPAKASKDAGAVLIAGSDAPVLTQDPQPFVNMEIGVTRSRRGGQPLSPWQRLSIEEVIDAYTINGARALNRGAEIGSLEVGKSADFIIVDQDILELARSGRPEKIGDTKVLGTWFMGKKVYSPSSE